MNEETKAEIVVARSDWEGFITSLERLITLHHKTLKRLKDLRIRNEALRTELRSALALPTVKQRFETGFPASEELVALQRCRYCDREIEMSAKFCDRCGRTLAVRLCECGRELGRFDRFCDSCGRPATGS